MSFKALAWAAEQRPNRSADKLVLFALADRHNTEDDLAWPSIAWIVGFTSLDRKTVVASLARLMENHYIDDTGKRFGKTGQVKGFRLCLERTEAMPADQQQHYVYRLINPETGEFYIGVRTCFGDPAKDLYRGSGTWPTSGIKSLVKLDRVIVAVFDSRLLAEQAEAGMIRVATGNPLCMNEVGKNGTLNGKSAVFPRKETRKRDTDTVREPIPSTKTSSSSKVSRAKRKQTITDDFWPSPSDGSVTAEIWNGWSEARQREEVERFIGYHSARATTMVDWNRAFTTWATNQRRYDKEKADRNGAGTNDQKRGDGFDHIANPMVRTGLRNEARRRAGRGQEYASRSSSAVAAGRGGRGAARDYDF